MLTWKADCAFGPKGKTLCIPQGRRTDQMPRAIAAPFSLGVAFLSPHPEHRFLFEILDHSGLAYCVTEDPDSTDAIDACQVWLIACHLRDGLPEVWRRAATARARAGLAQVFLGNPLGMEDLFTVEMVEGVNRDYRSWLGAAQSTGEGYFAPDDSLASAGRPLHFFGGYAVRAAAGCAPLGKVLDRHGAPTALLPAVRPSSTTVGIFIDLVGTVRHITHGTPVVADGVPAPDGSAPLNDNILKAEDGHVLDWQFDRDDPCGAGFAFFSEPIADCWREILLSAIFSAAHAAGAPLDMLWLYPAPLRALGHISFDTDGSDPALAHQLLDVLNAIGIRSTWFVIPPGYTHESGVISSAKAAGHEIGLHFDAGIQPGSRADGWTHENFLRQLREVAEACDVDGFRSNKNHYTRWQDAADILEWCARAGIAADETKLPSKPGTLGFFSGSSHPWYHHNLVGEPIGCLEIASLSQDPIVTVPPVAHSALLNAAVRRHGIASFTFHPAHIAKPGVADALRALVDEGRALGLEFWTASEIADWEMLRREARLDSAGMLVGKAAKAKRPPLLLKLDAGGRFTYLGFSFSPKTGAQPG